MTLRLLRLLPVIALVAAAACRGDAPPDGDATAADPPSHAVTIWSDKTELFMEFPPLVAGADARFAVHLTDLSSFAPLRDGKVVVRFEGDSIHRYEAAGPSTPGIFGVDVVVPAARRYQLVVEVHAASITDELRVGAVTVHTDQAAAIAAMPGDEGEGATAFLKEQQWTLEFATARVEGKPHREVLTVPATIEPRAGGSVDVRSPAAGRVVSGSPRTMGAAVGRGATLAEIIARNDRIGEAPVLKVELAQAEAQLRLAEQELARIERLAAAGAVPQRRVAETRAAQEAATARVTIAREQLQHLELSRTGQGTGDPGERVIIRAPIAGAIVEHHATPGAAIEAGALLYRIVAVDRVNVVGAVPEQHVARLQNITAAEIEVPGLPSALRTARLLSIGRVVDPIKRSVPITFELVNPPSAVAVGQAVTLRLIAGARGNEIAVPANAVIDDGGQPIVFIQTGGESFERRPVRVGGQREGGLVQITEGLDGGERIVTRGAHLVRLAALSPRTPGHGHVH
jgi:cobalt-zinc-cadmium efflux system membrane fusion protein